jgi:hypothetical protein
MSERKQFIFFSVTFLIAILTPCAFCEKGPKMLGSRLKYDNIEDSIYQTMYSRGHLKESPHKEKKMLKNDDEPIFKYYLKPFTASPYYIFIDAFLQGLKLETYVKGAENCILSIIFTGDDLFYLYNNISDFRLRSWEAPVMNITKIISGNIANGIYDCAVMYTSFIAFYKERFAFFKSDLGTFLLAFLFNMMGNAVKIQNILEEI